MALDTTYTSSGYNAYATVAAMDDAMVEVGVVKKNTFWASLTTPEKEALIKAATRNINKESWRGAANENIVVASMLWPRTDITGVGDTEIPEELVLRMACWVTYNAAASKLRSQARLRSRSVSDTSVSFGGSQAVGDYEDCSAYATQYLVSSGSVAGIGTVGLRRMP